MQFPHELLLCITGCSDYCTALSFKLSCKQLNSLPLFLDNTLRTKLEQLRMLVWRKYSDHFLGESRIKNSHISAFMGYSELFFDLSVERDYKKAFLVACVGDCVPIAARALQFEYQEVAACFHIGILLCAAFNSENVYTRFLYNQRENRDLIEIYATGRPWLNSHYNNERHINKTSFRYAILYRNTDLIRRTIPKRIRLVDVGRPKYLKQTDPVLYNWLVVRLSREVLGPGLTLILDDVELFRLWISNCDDPVDKEKIIAAANDYQAYDILEYVTSCL